MTFTCYLNAVHSKLPEDLFFVYDRADLHMHTLCVGPRPSSRLLQSSITTLIHPKLEVPRHPSTLNKPSSSSPLRGSPSASSSNAVQSKLPEDLRSSVISRKPVKKSSRKKRSYPKFYVQTTLDALSQAAKRKPAARKQYLLPKPSEVLGELCVLNLRVVR